MDALVASVQSLNVDLLATHTYTNGADYITETYAYDMLGNRIATTDALGNTTHREWLAPPDAGGSQLAATETAALHKIARTAQAILDARTRYPESSLADLSDPITKPSDLRAAHTSNDKTVLAAYGLAPDTPEPEIVAYLFKFSAEKTSADRDSYPLFPDAGVASFSYEFEIMNKIR